VSRPYDVFFPLAPQYRGERLDGRAVREEGVSLRGFSHSERHLQCVWFDPALRPARLRTREGEEVAVEDPGVWNLEAGPDFLGAILRVGPGRRRLAGDVEIHIHPHDWRAHGHATDPRYARVRLHVTYFTGALPSEELPSGALQLSLREALAATPSFSFENIEVAAYPFAARATRPPCLEVVQPWNAPEKQAVLEAAGHERLRRKAARLAARRGEVGEEQTLYEEVMAGLGYQHNKAAMRQLAERVPLDRLGEQARGPLEALAILLGVAGLLPTSPASRWDEETRVYFRGLWDAWWKVRDGWVDQAMPRAAWRLQGRPANHPVRRLAAAAALFGGRDKLPAQWSAWSDRLRGRTLAHLTASLQKTSDAYWDHRVSWGGVRSKKPVALLGADRAQAIVVNVAVPYLAVRGKTDTLSPELLAHLPVEASNSLIRQTAFNLFGPHHPVSLYRTGLRRQGLLQIFHDYCLNDRSRCAACTFPALLRAWKKG
jgi:hypothetical protein